MIARTALIFDMDGLMVDSEPLSRQAWEQLLIFFGHYLDDATYGQMIGHRIDITANFVQRAFHLPISTTEIIHRKEEIFDIKRANGVPVMAGMMELHEEITRRDLPWGVATSSLRHHAHIILDQLGLRESCQAVASGDEVKSPKPAPDIYLLAAEKLGVPPSQCLVFEDSSPGSWAAVAAGMKVVAIPNGDTKTADFSHVDHIFNSLHDVVNNLDKLLSD